MMAHDTEDQIGAAAHRLFNDIFASERARALQQDGGASEWSQCVDGGFVDALLPEAAGGIGLNLSEYFTIALAAGACASPLPVVHTALFRRVLADAAHGSVANLPDGAITFVDRISVIDGSMQAIEVPWAGVSNWALVNTAHGAWLLPVDRTRQDNGSTASKAPTRSDTSKTAGNGGDLGPVTPLGISGTLRWDATTPAAWAALGGAAVDIPWVRLRGIAAAGYSALLAGVLQRMLDTTVQYAAERQQFGKPIGRFQAIQQQISAMAERVIAARMAAQIGFTDAVFADTQHALAVAKAITSEVVPLAASIAHAVHGAIGITEEYDLQRYSGCAHLWRGAAGGEVYWRKWIGHQVLQSTALPRDMLRTVFTPA